MSCSLSVYRPFGELVARWRNLFTTQTFEDLKVGDVIGAPLFRFLRDGRSIQLRGHIFESEDETVDLIVVIFGAFDVKGYFSNWQLPVDVHMPELSGRIQINGNVLLGDVCEQLIERLFGDNTADAKLKSRLSHYLRTLEEYHEGASVYNMEILPFVNVDHPDEPQASSSCKSVKTFRNIHTLEKIQIELNVCFMRACTGDPFLHLEFRRPLPVAYSDRGPDATARKHQVQALAVVGQAINQTKHLRRLR